MANETEIIICLGSSCFSRKNRDTVTAVQEYVQNKNLSNIVKIKGGHCFGECSKGPIIIVNGEKFYEITPVKAVAILESFVFNKA
jgi:NADH:ubiquinone oxidoreductase subunit E